MSDNSSKYPKPAITVEKGYLLVPDKETEDCITALVEQGNLWEMLSMLIQQYAHRKSIEVVKNESEERDKQILLAISQLNKDMQNFMKALPSGGVTEKVIKPKDVVESPSVTIKEVKPNPLKGGNSGLLGLVHNFGNLGKK